MHVVIRVANGEEALQPARIATTTAPLILITSWLSHIHRPRWSHTGDAHCNSCLDARGPMLRTRQRRWRARPSRGDSDPTPDFQVEPCPLTITHHQTTPMRRKVPPPPNNCVAPTRPLRWQGGPPPLATLVPLSLEWRPGTRRYALFGSHLRKCNISAF